MNNPEALSEKPVVLDWNLSVSWVFKSVTNSLFFYCSETTENSSAACKDTKYQSVFVISDEKDECIIATEVSISLNNSQVTYK